MISDINKLIFAYLVEPIYGLADWVKNKSTHPDKLTNNFQHNPRIVGQLRNIPTSELTGHILKNPHRGALRHMKRYIKEYEYNSSLRHNKTRDPKLIHWANEQMGKQYLNRINEILFDSDPDLVQPNLTLIIEEEFNRIENTTENPEEEKTFMIINILKEHKIPEKYEWYIARAIKKASDDIRYSELLRPLFTSGSKQFIRIIETLMSYINTQAAWNLSENPNALEVLNANPHIIYPYIYKNQNPLIIKMIACQLSAGCELEASKLQYPAIYITLKERYSSGNLNILENPGAIGILETRIDIFEKLFTSTISIILPDNISDRIVDILESYIIKYQKIPHGVLMCESPKLIKLFEKYKDLIKNIEQLSNNPYILSETKPNIRLINRINLLV